MDVVFGEELFSRVHPRVELDVPVPIFMILVDDDHHVQVEGGVRLVEVVEMRSGSTSLFSDGVDGEEVKDDGLFHDVSFQSGFTKRVVILARLHDFA